MNLTIKGKGTKKYDVQIDDEDYEKIKDLKWVYCRGYAVAHVSYFMHRIIANTPPQLQTDHINGNPLDNRKCNLRIATGSDNMRNCRKRRNTSSKYKGVTYHKAGKAWTAYIHRGGLQIYLGSFESERHAAMAYDLNAAAVYGEFIRPNFPNAIKRINQ